MRKKREQWEIAHRLEVFAVAAAVPLCPAVVPPVTLVVGMLATLYRKCVKGIPGNSKKTSSSLRPTKRKDHEQYRADILSSHGDKVCAPESSQESCCMYASRIILTVLQS